MNRSRGVVLTLVAAILVVTVIDPACGARHLIRRAASCEWNRTPIGLDGLDLRQAGRLLPFAVGFYPGEQG